MQENFLQSRHRDPVTADAESARSRLYFVLNRREERSKTLHRVVRQYEAQFATVTTSLLGFGNVRRYQTRYRVYSTVSFQYQTATYYQWLSFLDLHLKKIYNFNSRKMIANAKFILQE